MNSNLRQSSKTLISFCQRSGIVIPMIVFLLLTTGCKTVPPASKEATDLAISFTPPSNMAGLYIFEPRHVALCNVFLDGYPVGQVASKSYLYLPVMPGEHDIQIGVMRAAFTAVSGNNYCFRMKTYSLVPIAETEARTDANELTLSSRSGADFISSKGSQSSGVSPEDYPGWNVKKIEGPERLFTAYESREKIHLKIGVNITDDLLQIKSERHPLLYLVGNSWDMRPGKSVAANASALARHIFDDEIDLSNGQLPPNDKLAAILTPKIVYFNRTEAATALGGSIYDIKVEWTLADMSGNTIWVETIDGQSTGSSWGATASDKILAWMLADMLLKSEKAITSSQAIQQFAQKQNH